MLLGDDVVPSLALEHECCRLVKLHLVLRYELRCLHFDNQGLPANQSDQEVGRVLALLARFVDVGQRERLVLDMRDCRTRQGNLDEGFFPRGFPLYGFRLYVGRVHGPHFAMGGSMHDRSGWFHFVSRWWRVAAASLPLRDSDERLQWPAGQARGNFGETASGRWDRSTTVQGVDDSSTHALVLQVVHLRLIPRWRCSHEGLPWPVICDSSALLIFDWAKLRSQRA